MRALIAHLAFITALALCLPAAAQDERQAAPSSPSTPEVAIFNQDPGGEEPDWKIEIKRLVHGCQGGLMDCLKAAGVESWPWIADQNH